MTQTPSETASADVARLAVRWVAVLCMGLASSGCLLTSDLPDPALDVPSGYKAAGSTKAMDAPPTLDWWRGFRAAELTAPQATTTTFAV